MPKSHYLKLCNCTVMEQLSSIVKRQTAFLSKKQTNKKQQQKTKNPPQQKTNKQKQTTQKIPPPPSPPSPPRAPRPTSSRVFFSCCLQCLCKQSRQRNANESSSEKANKSTRSAWGIIISKTFVDEMKMTGTTGQHNSICDSYIEEVWK